MPENPVPTINARMRMGYDVPNFETGELLQELHFDTAFELLECAIAFGIIKHRGSGNHVVMDDDGDETNQKWRSAAQTRAGLAEDEDLQERIQERLLLAT